MILTFSNIWIVTCSVFFNTKNFLRNKKVLLSPNIRFSEKPIVIRTYGSKEYIIVMRNERDYILFYNLILFYCLYNYDMVYGYSDRKCKIYMFGSFL